MAMAAVIPIVVPLGGTARHGPDFDFVLAMAGASRSEVAESSAIVAVWQG